MCTKTRRVRTAHCVLCTQRATHTLIVWPAPDGNRADRTGNFTMATAIRCTLPNCSCECFAPGKSQLRSCEQCRHGWVAHALDKLSTSQSFPSLRAEVVHSDIVFDIASLILYGTLATPIRLRILLDRLFSVLKSEEVDRILQGLGWGHEDYARGYILQDEDGKVLEQWTLSSNEEEPTILNQFLRFGETKSIAEVMLKELQMKDSQQVQKKNESDIRAFIERISGGRKLVNNSYSGNDVERLPATAESPRTLQKPQLPGDVHGPDAERHQTITPKQITEQRCSDTLTEFQAKRMRKKGGKDGTPCQYSRCDCTDFDAPGGAQRNTWLVTCTSCRHTESEHRLPTNLDKQRKKNIENANNWACVGCDSDCKGYCKPDSSVPVESPLAKQCANCKHSVECHRPPTSLDKLITNTLTGRFGLPCRLQMDKDDKQMMSMSINDSDGAEIGAWFEPTNIDPDDDDGIVAMKVCRCRGFCPDNLARICQKYYGFTAEIVTPFLSQTPCQRCSHALNLHRLPNEQEKATLERKKENNLTLSGVMSFGTCDNFASQEAIDALLPRSSDPYEMAMARVETSATEGGFSIIISLSPSSPVNNQGRGGRKRNQMGNILKDVKQKIKRQKTNEGPFGSPESDSSKEDGSQSGDFTFPKKLINGLTLQGKGQAVVHCGTDAPTALALCTLEIKRKKRIILLASGSTTGSVAVHSVSTEDCQEINIEGSMKCPTSSVSKLALHPSESTLYSGHMDGTVAIWIWDVKMMKMSLVDTRRDRKCRVSALAATADRKYVAVGYQNGDVLLYETVAKAAVSPRKSSVPQPTSSSNLKLISSCCIAYGAVTSLAWHPYKIIVAAGGEDDNVTVFYMFTKTTKTRRRGTIMHYFSPKKLLKPNTFYKCAVLKGHKSFVSSVTFDPQGDLLLSAGWDGQVLLWSTAEIDDIIKIGDVDATTMECLSGFILGQSQRAQKRVGAQGGGCPFVPLWMGVMGEGVFTLMRSCSSKVHFVGYEMPKKILF